MQGAAWQGSHCSRSLRLPEGAAAVARDSQPSDTWQTVSYTVCCTAFPTWPVWLTEDRSTVAWPRESVSRTPRSQSHTCTLQSPSLTPCFLPHLEEELLALQTRLQERELTVVPAALHCSVV